MLHKLLHAIIGKTIIAKSKITNLYHHRDGKNTLQVARNKAGKDPASSRFDDDGNDAGGSGGEEERAAEAKLSRFESRFEPQEKRDQVKNNREEEYTDDQEEEGGVSPPVMEAVKSKEEILEEMGINIRRLMTGLLLEVILNIVRFQIQNINLNFVKGDS